MDWNECVAWHPWQSRLLVFFEICYYRNVRLLIAYSKIHFVVKSEMMSWDVSFLFRLLKQCQRAYNVAQAIWELVWSGTRRVQYAMWCYIRQKSGQWETYNTDSKGADVRADLIKMSQWSFTSSVCVFFFFLWSTLERDVHSAGCFLSLKMKSC